MEWQQLSTDQKTGGKIYENGSLGDKLQFPNNDKLPEQLNNHQLVSEQGSRLNSYLVQNHWVSGLSPFALYSKN
jgi:hypothetical protein